MKFINIVFMSTMSLLVVSCGGGGGGSSASPSTANSTPSPVIEDPVVTIVAEPEVIKEPVVKEIIEIDPNAVYETTSELVAAKSFLLKPEYDLAINYVNKDGRDAYLSVCTDFTEEADTVKVDYNSCLLRTSISDDYQGVLTVANDNDRLVMAIWYLDDAKNPVYEIWQHDADAEDMQHFSVN